MTRLEHIINLHQAEKHHLWYNFREKCLVSQNSFGRLLLEGHISEYSSDPKIPIIGDMFAYTVLSEELLEDVRRLRGMIKRHLITLISAEENQLVEFCRKCDHLEMMAMFACSPEFDALLDRRTIWREVWEFHYHSKAPLNLRSLRETYLNLQIRKRCVRLREELSHTLTFEKAQEYCEKLREDFELIEGDLVELWMKEGFYAFRIVQDQLVHNGLMRDTFLWDVVPRHYWLL